jgi:outer membrane protein
MKFKIIPLFIASALFAASTASAENLVQVYQQAKAYDPQLKAFEASFRSTRENIKQAQAALKPQASLSASSSLGIQNTHNADFGNGYSHYSSSNYTLSVNQAIYRKELIAQLNRTKASVSQARAELEGRRQELLIRTAERYFNVLLNQENLTFARAEKKAIGKQLEQVKAYFEAGILAITDVKETQSRHDQAAAKEVDAANQVALAIEALQVITGRNYSKLLGISRGIRLDRPKPNNIKTWLNLADRNSKQIQSAKHAIRAAQKNVEQQRAERKPKVDVFARHTGTITEDFGSGISDSIRDDTSIGIQLSMPLYTSGSIASKIQGARQLLQSSQHDLQLQKQLVVQQVRSAYLTVISDISRAESLKQALNSAEVALEATQAGFEVGTRTAVDVLLSLRNVFAAKRDYASARYNYLLNMLKLRQAAGTININDLKKTTALLGR